jgi:plastocyanin
VSGVSASPPPPAHATSSEAATTAVTDKRLWSAPVLRRMLACVNPLLVAILLVLAGCSNQAEPTSRPSPTTPDEARPTETVTESVPAPPPADLCVDETITGNAQVTIRETDFDFEPVCLVVLGGQGLEILNRGETLHNFAVEGTAVDLDTRPGEATRTEPLASILEPGTHKFICKYHAAQGMRGEITLTEAG